MSVPEHDPVHVEKAARAAYGVLYGTPPIEGLTLSDERRFTVTRGIARAVLDAVAADRETALREQIAAEIEALPGPGDVEKGGE